MDSLNLCVDLFSMFYLRSLLAEHWEQLESRGYQTLKDLFSSHSIIIFFKYANESFSNSCNLSLKKKLLGPLYSDLSNRM
jgi:hypothetical protein